MLSPANAVVIDCRQTELFNERGPDDQCDVRSAGKSRRRAGDLSSLDGIPLAIELAAARTSSMSPPDLVARLGDRLQLLTGGRRTSAERHRTLRATIGWSYDLLTRPTRRSSGGC